VYRYTLGLRCRLHHDRGKTRGDWKMERLTRRSKSSKVLSWSPAKIEHWVSVTSRRSTGAAIENVLAPAEDGGGSGEVHPRACGQGW